MARAIAVAEEASAPVARGAAPEIVEPVTLLTRGAKAGAAARDLLGDLVAIGAVDIIEAPFGDIWLRDTGPIFLEQNGALAAASFIFNGWGDKYRLPHDDQMAHIIAERAHVKIDAFDLVLEGGAIDTDGEGTFLTTRQCLLNRNRNPGKSQSDIEAALGAAFGAKKVIWLEDGLLNDHTDGHIDNIARFIAPGKIVCMRPEGADDPNGAVYREIRKTLDAARDASGRPFEVIDIPSPGRIDDEDGRPMPASHMNFYISNGALIMPHYAKDAAARETAQEIASFLARHCGRARAFALSARALLSGGGAFHCITQQQPAPRAEGSVSS